MSDDDETDVDPLSGGLDGVGCVGHVGIFRDGSEKVGDGPGMVVGCCFDFGFGDGKGLRSDGSEGAIELGKNLWDRTLEEPGVLVD